MKRKIHVILAVISSLAFAAPVLAQQMDEQQQSESGQQEVQQAGQQQDLISSNWLIGKTVYSLKAEELGNISNLIMDKKTGNVGYVTINTGDFFDFSEEKQIVPYKALNVTEDQVTLDMDQEKFDQAPDWRSGLTVEEFNRETEEFFGVGPAWGSGEDEGANGDGVFEDEAGATEDEGNDMFEEEQEGVSEDEAL